MADLAASVGGKAAGKAVDYARHAIVEQNRGQYNEEDIKARILSEVEQIKEDTKVLRIKDFKTARDRLEAWTRSPEPMSSDRNLDRLKTASNSAAEAFNTVPDPVDKVTSAGFIIYADYHYVALTSPSNSEGSLPNWTSGKREAQSLLMQYVDKMKELSTAADEELGTSTFRRMLKDKEKRRKLLRAFVNLSASVFSLHPVSENANHPRFEHLEEAVLHCCKKTTSLGLTARVNHIISEPLEVQTLQGHTGSVYCCAVTPNGSRLVSSSADETLKVWDLDSGEVNHTLRGHLGWVCCCAVTLDGFRVISSSRDGFLKVWDLDSGEEVCTLKGHTNCVSCCAVTPAGSRAISGSWDETLKVWDLDSREEILTLRGHTDAVTCCAVTPDGSRAISGSSDNTLRVWDLERGEEIRTLRGHTNTVSCCAVTPDGSKVISGSNDKTLKVWDLERGKEVHTLQGHTHWVNCCVIPPDCSRVISGSGDETLKVLDIDSGELVHSLRGHTDNIACCTFTPDGSRLFSGSHDRTLKVWALPIGTPLPLGSLLHSS